MKEICRNNMSNRGSALITTEEARIFDVETLTTLAYSAHLSWRAVPGSVTTDQGDI
jgi:hypothetical protein